MKLFPFATLLGIALVALTGTARAETIVELKGTHLCCGQCVKAVGEILAKVDDVKGKCDQKAGTVTITAKDDAAAKKALEALAAGGFHGDTGNKDLAIADDSGAAKGKVDKLTVTTHNCCAKCTTGLKAVLGKVDGVKADTVKPKENTFEVTGDFDAVELVKALNAAGFHVKVKK